MRDATVALVLGALTALTRLPFAARVLWEWDSVLYARALENGFHVDDTLAASRPHPPGYVFYVATAALFHAAGLDSDRALVAVSIVASGLAAAALYLLCRRFAGTGTSALLTVAFAADPLVWLHGEVAMPYVLLAPLGTLLAGAFLAARGEARRTVLASLLLGALAGFRQDLLLFFAPLWLYIQAPAAWSTRVGAAAALAAGCLAWFIPSAVLSDGAAAYVSSVYRQLTGLGGVSAAGERSLAVNTVLLWGSIAWALALVAPLLAVLLLARWLALARRTARPGSGPRLGAFFALWILPPLLFYELVHIGEWGFVLSLVPALYALCAWLLAPVAASLPAPGRRAGALALAAAAAVAAGVFVLGDDAVFSARSLASHDRDTTDKTAYIRDHYPPDAAVVLAAAEVLVARYYLPAYRVWAADDRAASSYERRLGAPATLVVYEEHARPLGIATPRRVEVGDAALELGDAPAGTLRLPGGDIDVARH